MKTEYTPISEFNDSDSNRILEYMKRHKYTKIFPNWILTLPNYIYDNKKWRSGIVQWVSIAYRTIELEIILY